jgi:hypothetical protein
MHEPPGGNVTAVPQVPPTILIWFGFGLAGLVPALTTEMPLMCRSTAPGLVTVSAVGGFSSMPRRRLGRETAGGEKAIPAPAAEPGQADEERGALTFRIRRQAEEHGVGAVDGRFESDFERTRFTRGEAGLAVVGQLEAIFGFVFVHEP